MHGVTPPSPFFDSCFWTTCGKTGPNDGLLEEKKYCGKQQRSITVGIHCIKELYYNGSVRERKNTRNLLIILPPSLPPSPQARNDDHSHRQSLFYHSNKCAYCCSPPSERGVVNGLTANLRYPKREYSSFPLYSKVHGTPMRDNACPRSYPVSLANVPLPGSCVLPSVSAAENSSSMSNAVQPLPHEHVAIGPGVDAIALWGDHRVSVAEARVVGRGGRGAGGRAGGWRRDVLTLLHTSPKKTRIRLTRGGRKGGWEGGSRVDSKQASKFDTIPEGGAGVGRAGGGRSGEAYVHPYIQ